ncbi:MAG: hypothetical protein ACYDFT_06980, partial [Thermoplasmata archaeon]
MVEPETKGGDPVGHEITLAPAERQILRCLQKRSGLWEESELPGAASLPEEVVRGVLQRLRAKRLVLVEEEHRERPRLTARGLSARAKLLPERRLLSALVQRGGLLPAEELVATAGLEPEERSVAIGVLRRRGFLEEGVPFRIRPAAPDPHPPLPEEIAIEEAAEGRPGSDPPL